MLVSIKKQCCRTRKVTSKDNDMDSAIPQLPVRINHIKRLTFALLYGADGLSNIIPNNKQRIWTKLAKPLKIKSVNIHYKY